MGGKGPKAEQLAAITAGMASRQEGGEPVHTWVPATLDEGGGWQQNYLKVEQWMDTDILTVNEHEPVELVAQLMDWNNIRYVLVEDDENRLVGQVSQRVLLRLVGNYNPDQRDSPMPVSEIMQTAPVTVAPETTTLETITLMRRHRMSCLPVVKNGQLIGRVTERQFMIMARQLLVEKLEKG